MTDLEALAAAKRKRQARDDAARARDRRERATSQGREGAAMLRKSLRLPSLAVRLVVFLAAAAIAAGVALGVRQLFHHQTATAMTGGAVLFVAMALVDRLVGLVLNARERRWLDGLPFPVDREGYFAVLSRKAYTACMEVRVTFAAPVPGEARALVADATAEALFARVAGLFSEKARAEVAFRGNVLVIKSPSIPTRFRIHQKDSVSKTVHHNRYVHRWFRRGVDRALRAVHARHPIARVDVSCS